MALRSFSRPFGPVCLLATLACVAVACGDVKLRLTDSCVDDRDCGGGQICSDGVCAPGCTFDDDCRRSGAGFYCRDARCTNEEVEGPLLLVLEVAALGRFEDPGPVLALDVDELSQNVLLDASGSVYVGEGEVTWSWRVLENPDALDVVLEVREGARATVTTPRVFRDAAVAVELHAAFAGGERTLRLDLAVRDSENEAPDLRLEGPVGPVMAGDVVALDASGTVDPNGDGLALPFTWRQTEGPAVTLRDATDDGSWRTVHFDAPEVAEDTDLVFEVEVSDQREPPAAARQALVVPVAAHEPDCRTDGDCDDADPCTVDTCVAASGTCTNEARADCCQSAADCDDADPCTTDSCDVASGDCSHAERPDCCRAAGDCDDGDPCTQDLCTTATGVCAHPAEDGCCEADPDCDDGDPCTTDTCDTASGDCGHVEVVGCCRADADCDDGAVCTTDRCDVATGACGHADVPDCCRAHGDCDDADPCTTDTCDTETGACANDAVADCCRGEADCDDGDPCTSDVCGVATNACSYQPIPLCCHGPSDCDDQDPCTTDSCDTASGECGHAEVAACCRADADCDDGDPCTDDACTVATGVCAHPASPGCCRDDAGCDDGDPCTDDTCDVASGDCSHTEFARCCRAHTDCNDGDVCTTDSCDVATGECVYAEVPICCRGPFDCDDGDVCTTDTCDTPTGVCGHDEVAGCCRAHGDCDDGDVCTTDTCTTATGACGHAEVPRCCRADAECDDGDLCTGDTCELATGACRNVALPGCCSFDADCADGDPCTGDACDVATGDCSWTPIPGCCVVDADCPGVPAECTVNRCVDGTCQYRVPVEGGTCQGGSGVCVGGQCCGRATCETLGVACGSWDDGCGGTVTCGTCPGSDTCSPQGVCVTTCNVPCPDWPGYSVECNEMGHCQYKSVDQTGWRRWDSPIYVPPGPFPMGDPDAQPGAWQYPVHTVDIAAGYWIDRFEVTAAAFAAFLNARASNACGGFECLALAVNARNIGWAGAAAPVATVFSVCQSVPNGLPNQSCAEHPVGGATWYGAGAYCRSQGKRLCTESEYERAAKGTEHRKFPWGGDVPGPLLANCVESDCGDGFGGTAPVESFTGGTSPVGCQNLSGNAWEWVEDDWHDSYDTPPGHPTDGSAWVESPRNGLRVLRGGGWGHDAAGMKSTDRFYHAPQVTSDFSLGFRCCR